ncbi:PspC domain-containing protein [Leifsonia kafniensis]
MNDAPHSTASSPAASPQVTRFFDWVRSTGIDRGHDRWFAGVCGGIAFRTGLDPLIVRGIAIVLAILGAPVLFAYAIGWALLPNQSGRIHAEQAFRGVFEPAMIAIGALVLFTIVPFTRGLWWEGPPLAWGMPDWLSTTFTVGWTIAVIVGIVWLVIYLLRRVPAPNSAFRSPPPAAPSGPPASPYSPPSPAASPSAPPSEPSSSSAAFVTTPFVTDPSGTTDAPANAANSSGFGSAAFDGAATTDAASTTATPASPASPAANSASGPAAFGATAAGATFGAGAAGATFGAAAGPTPPSTAQPRSAWDALVDQSHGTAGSKTDWNSSAAAHKNRHPGAGFTAIMLGIGLTLGAAASAVYSGVFDGGTWSGAALLVGLAFTLGVLALGIIIAGIRGRTSGAMGGFAFLAAATLLVLGVLPQGTQFALVGAPTWSVSSSAADAVSGYAVVAGAPTIDLTALDNARATDGRTIDVWLGFGETELVLPDDRPVTVEVNTFIGGLDYQATSGSTRSSTERGGIFLHDSRTFNGSDARAVPHIRVWTFIGQVTVVDAR